MFTAKVSQCRQTMEDVGDQHVVTKRHFKREFRLNLISFRATSYAVIFLKHQCILFGWETFSVTRKKHCKCRAKPTNYLPCLSRRLLMIKTTPRGWPRFHSWKHSVSYRDILIWKTENDKKRRFDGRIKSRLIIKLSLQKNSKFNFVFTSKFSCMKILHFNLKDSNSWYFTNDWSNIFLALINLKQRPLRSIF
jgi:hypothetical protein